MPNWCNNSVVISGKIKVLKEIQEAIKDKGFLDSVDPTPAFLKTIHTGGANAIDRETGEEVRVTKWLEEEVDGKKVNYALTSEQKKHLKDTYGTDEISWYQWNIQERGTKWAECDLDHDGLDEEFQGGPEDEDSFFFSFQTAWGPCCPIIVKTARKWGVGVRLEYFEEAAHFAGTLEYSAPDASGEPELVEEEYFEDLDEMLECGIDYIVEEANYHKEWMDECAEDEETEEPPKQETA